MRDAGGWYAIAVCDVREDAVTELRAAIRERGCNDLRLKLVYTFPALELYPNT